MKNIKPDLIEALRSGFCTPRIVELAKKMKNPAATIHYNIKQLEADKSIKAYKAVFDYKKIGEGNCAYLLINLLPDEYSDIERIAKNLSKYGNVESVDMLTGDWDFIVKVRTKDSDEYYQFLRNLLAHKGIAKVHTLTSLKQIKSEFVRL